jgi:hypothetical protein
VRLRHPISAVLALLLLGTSSLAETSVFIGQVLGERANGFDTTVLQRYLGDGAQAEIGQHAGRISKEVIDRIDGHPSFSHFARPVDVYAELPDDILMMVLAIEGANESQWYMDAFDTTSNSVVKGVMRAPEIGVSLQLVDPRTGQLVYSDIELLASDHDTTARGSLLEPGQNLPIAERGLYSLTGDAFNVPDGTTTSDGLPGYQTVSRASMHMNLAGHAVNRLVTRMLNQFNGTVSETHVVRRIDRSQGLFLLNRGRTDGLFPGSRLATQDGAFVVEVVESQPRYALAKVAHGDADVLANSLWTVLQGYLPSTGFGSTLTTVGRVVLSPSLLTHPRLRPIAEDEARLEARLGGTDGESPIYQPFLASRASAALAQTGRYRVLSPAGSLAPIKRAKSRMNAALNLKQRAGDPLFYESLVRPDRVLTLYLAAPAHQYTHYIAPRTERLQQSRKNSMWRLGGGLVMTGIDPHLTLASATSGRAASGAEIEWSATSGKPALMPASDHNQVIRECLLGSLDDELANSVSEAIIPSAIKHLTDTYDPIDVTGRITDADEAEVAVEFFDPAVATVGEIVPICAEVGKLPLDPDGGRITTVLRNVGLARVAEQEGRKWYLDVIEWAQDVDPTTLVDMGAVVPLYGRNASRTDPLSLGSLAVTAEAPGDHPLSDTDAQLMLLAEVSRHPELPVETPPYLAGKIAAFHKAKFVDDAAYRGALPVPASGSPVSHQPPYTLHLEVTSLEAPVVQHEHRSIEKTLDINCHLAISLLAPDGTPACASGQAATNKQRVVRADDYDGQIAGQIWLADTLPKFLKFYRTKKMEQMP